jgi:hypothetical protein
MHQVHFQHQPREAIEKRSLDPTTSQPTVRSQSAHTTNRRSYLHSAAPEPAVLTPVHRPDQGGNAGKIIKVYTNHFRVKIATIGCDKKTSFST